MYLHIITPCSRPENLHKIAESINIPPENYQWFVVFDMPEKPDKSLIPEKCNFTTCYQYANSVYGHAQRNFILRHILGGHVYFIDDDTILHPDLWENIKNLDADFISFAQNDKHGNLRLRGDKIEVGHIDSHNFIVSGAISRQFRFQYLYEADGIFATQCHAAAKTKHYIPKVLSVYNALR